MEELKEWEQPLIPLNKKATALLEGFKALTEDARDSLKAKAYFATLQAMQQHLTECCNEMFLRRVKPVVEDAFVVVVAGQGPHLSPLGAELACQLNVNAMSVRRLDRWRFVSDIYGHVSTHHLPITLSIEAQRGTKLQAIFNRSTAWHSDASGFLDGDDLQAVREYFMNESHGNQEQLKIDLEYGVDKYTYSLNKPPDFVGITSDEEHEVYSHALADMTMVLAETIKACYPKVIDICDGHW